MDNFFLNNEIKPTRYNSNEYYIDLTAEYMEDNLLVSKVKTLKFGSLEEANSIFYSDNDVLLEEVLNNYDEIDKFIVVNNNIQVHVSDDNKFISTLDMDSNITSIAILKDNELLGLYSINYKRNQIIMELMLRSGKTSIWYKYNNDGLLSSISYFTEDRLMEKKLFDYNYETYTSRSKMIKYNYAGSVLSNIITIAKFEDDNFDNELYEYRYHNYHYNIKEITRFYNKDDIELSVSKYVK